MSEPNDEQLEAEVLAELAKVDAEMQLDEAPEPTPDAQAPEQDTEAEPEGGQPEDEASAEAGTEPAKAQEVQQPTEQKPQSKFEKEKARQQNAWQKIEAEKAEIRKQREELEKFKAEQAQKAAKKPEPYRDKDGWSAEDYEKFAKDYEEDPDSYPNVTPQMIRMARQKAEHLRREETEVQTSRQREAQEAVIKQTVEKNPELKDVNSPLGQKLKELFDREKDDPFYSTHIEGFARAVEHAKAELRAGSVPVLEKQITDLKKEVDRLTKLTTPSKPGSQPASKKAPTNAVPSEDELERLTAQWDAQGIPVHSL